jgi:hypothetical protein
MSQAAVSVEVDEVGPRPGDDVGGPLRNLLVCGASLGMSGSIALCDAILAPESSGTVSPGATGLLLPVN